MSGDLVPGRMIAYRAWQIDDGELSSLSGNLAGPGTGPWTTATAVAECRDRFFARPHPEWQAPAAGCSCGLYAYYRPSTVRSGPAAVFGAVEVSGRVILATRGLKAERMRILALVAADDEEEHQLLQRYGVPTYRSHAALLEDFPPQDYSALVDVDESDALDLARGGLVRVAVKVDLAPFIQAIDKAAHELAAAAGLTAREAGENLRRVGIAFAQPIPELAAVVDAKARALELRRHRSTGPGAPRLDGRRR